MENALNTNMIVFLDAGHGGVDPKTGVYTTDPKQGKLWKHGNDGFHKDGVFLEGVFNRIMASKIETILESAGIRVVRVYHKYKDTPLSNRTTIANTYHKLVQQGIYLSIHANSSPEPGKARGACVLTSLGKTESDNIAALIIKHINKDIPVLARLYHTFEQNLHVLKYTDMPSILLEAAFFDNYEDAKLLMQDSIQNNLAAAVAKGIIEHIKLTPKWLL